MVVILPLRSKAINGNASKNAWSMTIIDFYSREGSGRQLGVSYL